MDFITKGLIGTGGCWGASVGVKRGKVDLSVFGTNTGKNPSTFGTNTGKGTVIGAKAKFTIGGSNKGGRRQGRGFWGGRRGGSWRGLGGAGPVGGGGTGSGFGGGGGGGDRVETETLQVKINLILLLFVSMTLVGAQSPKRPHTQLNLPPIGLGAARGDNGPEGIIKVQDKNSPLTAWGSSNFRGKWGGGLGVKTPKWDFTGQGSVNTGGRWDARVGARRGNWDFSGYGRNAGRGLEVGGGIIYRFGGSNRRRGGGGGRGGRGGRLNFQEMMEQIPQE